MLTSRSAKALHSLTREVTIYGARLPTRLAASHFRNLSAGELERAERLRRPEHQAIFIHSRVILRKLLSQRLGCLPHEVEIRTETNGKPYVDGLHFNMSHSDHIIAIAISESINIGIDIELRSSAIKKLAAIPPEYLCSGTENPSNLLSVEAKLRIWTKKEATLKRFGFGLSIPMHDVRLESDAGISVATIPTCQDCLVIPVVIPHLSDCYCAIAL